MIALILKSNHTLISQMIYDFNLLICISSAFCPPPTTSMFNFGQERRNLFELLELESDKKYEKMAKMRKNQLVGKKIVCPIKERATKMKKNR